VNRFTKVIDYEDGKNWDRFLPEQLGFPLQLSLHNRSILILTCARRYTVLASDSGSK